MFNHLFMLAPDTGAGNGGGADPAGTNPAGSEAGGTPATPPAGPSADDVRADLFKDLGVDDLDSLKAIIKAQKDADAANHTDLENAKANLDKTSAALSKANQRATSAEAQLAAYKQGVGETHITDALALANADLAAKANGVKTIEDALKGVLERNPSFKSDTAAGVGADGTAVNNGNATGGASAIKTQAELFKMSTAELNAYQKEHPQEFASAFK